MDLEHIKNIDRIRIPEGRDINNGLCMNRNERVQSWEPKIIQEVRGRGLMKGIKMIVDNVEFMKKLMNHKMLTVKAEENVIRLFPPLIVENQELDEAIHEIETVCKEMS